MNPGILSSIGIRGRTSLFDSLLESVIVVKKLAEDSAIKHPNIVLVKTFFQLTPYFSADVIDLTYA